MLIGVAVEPHGAADPGVPARSPASSLGRPRSAPSAAVSEPVSVFARVLEGVGREVQHGESVVRAALAAARSGSAYGPAELIALQAGVYRYSEAVDLAAKLIDRATSGLKTVVQGQ